MRNIILARLRKIIATVELKVGQTINKGDEGIEMIQANRYVTENIIMADRTQGNDTIVKDSGVKEKIVGGKNVAAMAKAFSNDNIAQIFTKRFTQALRGNSKGDNLDLDNGTYTAYAGDYPGEQRQPFGYSGQQRLQPANHTGKPSLGTE